MFDLGQPNLVLLAMMLYGFWLLRHERPWMAGSMFALATAIKVFPVAVLSLSGLAPAMDGGREHGRVPRHFPVRGAGADPRLPAQCRGTEDLVPGHGRLELGEGFGQRDEQNWSWVNQSIIAMTHRLTRPVNYNQDDPQGQAAALHEHRRSRFQDGELDRAGDIAGDRARLSRGDADGFAANRAVRRRGARASCSA